MSKYSADVFLKVRLQKYDVFKVETVNSWNKQAKIHESRIRIL